MPFAALLWAVPLVARADSGALLGEGSSSAALADAVTARPGGIASLSFNPGAVADLERPELQVVVHGGRVAPSFQRPGEERLDLGRRVAGLGLGLAAPLPEPLSLLRIGGAVHVPTRHALRLTAPPRTDVPASPIYGSRAERTAFTLGAAANLLGRFQLGLALTLAPRLHAPTHVEYLPPREGETEGRLDVSIERELRIGLAWLVGIRYDLIEDRLALGFGYREAIITRARGDNVTRAGSIVTFEPIDFHDFVEPERLAWGVWGRPVPAWALSLDLVWQRWSDFRTIHGEVPNPPFDDVVLFRVGAEWDALPWLVLRAGYAFEPSPVPPQRGETNYVDGDRHVLAAGAGADLAVLGWPDLRVDAHVRSHVTHRRSVTKDAQHLPDASPIEGHQVDNLGYPGFESRAWALQAGVTLTVVLGSYGAGEGEP